MDVGDIRDELLARHEQMRAAVNDIRTAVDRVRRGDGKPADLQAALVQLAETLQTHCEHEDEVLKDMLRTVDAWGEERAEILDGEHARERRELREALVESASAHDVERLIGVAIHFAERMLEHFANEEQFVLSEDVLCDGIISRNSFCG